MVHIYVNVITTFTPKIKGKSQCINLILHRLQNVNEIFAHYKCAYIKLKHSTSPPRGFDALLLIIIEALWRYQL